MDIDRIQGRSTIRITPYEDRYREGMLEVARHIHRTSIYADMPLDEEKLVRQLSACGGVVPDRWFRLAVRGDEVLGGFYGCKMRVFFNDMTIVKDMGWWVTPTARGGAAAVVLLLAFEQWGREVGAWKAMIGQSGVENIDRTLKLFKHAGYRLTGYNTEKDLKNG